MEYGFSCGCCRNTFSKAVPSYDDPSHAAAADALEGDAGDAGWCIGFGNPDAIYLCPDCSAGSTTAHRLQSRLNKSA